MKPSKVITPAFLYFFLPEIGLKLDAPENPALWTDTQRSVSQKKNSDDLLKYLKIAQKKYSEGETDHPEVIEDVKCKFRDVISNYDNNLQETFKKRDCFSKYCAICDWYKEVRKVFSQLSDNSDYIIFNNAVLDFIRGEVLLEKSKLYDRPELKDYVYESRVESIYKKGNSLIPIDEPQKLVKCVKRYIKKGIEAYPDMDEFKLSIYKILEAYRMLYSSMSGVRKFLGSFRYDYNNLLWDTIAELESQIVTEEKNRRAVGFSKIQKRTPRAKKIDSYINSQYDKQNVIACLKSFIKGHKGKQVAIVLCAAYRAGLTTVERIPYATVSRAFGNIGAESGYNYYFREEALSEVDVNFVKDKLLNKFRVK